MAQGFDCAGPLKASQAQELANAGNKFAARYLVPESSPWKRLMRAEAEAITAAGMQIVSVFETVANRASGGSKNGTADGFAAYQEALKIGQPAGSAIYFAVDYDAGPKDFDAIEAYLRAAAAQIPGYQIGVYGSYMVIEEMAERGAAKHFWQTYAWSRGQKSAHANIYQYRNGETVAGVTLDLDESYGNEGWWNTNPVPTIQPASPDDTVKIVVNDKLAAYGRIIDGHAYLPLRQLGEALGVHVDWVAKEATPYVGGKKVIAFQLIGGKTYIGVRAAAELLGGLVSWDNGTKKVYLYK